MSKVLSNSWVLLLVALMLLGAFFLPWVQWEENLLPGYAVPSGRFFVLSGEEYNLGNPYPQLDILLKLFWLIPISCILVLLFAAMKKDSKWLAVLGGVSSLALITLFVLFTRTLTLLGIGTSVIKSLEPGIYIAGVAALVLILSVSRIKPILKMSLILIGPLAVWAGFTVIEKKISSEKYDDSANVKSAYKVGVQQLISEFRKDEVAANNKYREQILTVTGRITETESPNDSTIIIRMTDPDGSFAIFPFTEPYLESVRKLSPGDSIEVRASCSGGMYSEILETETITFKRCALIQTL